MSDNPITIVVRGGEGSGRSQIAAQIHQFLITSGYTDVAIKDGGAVVTYRGPGSIREVPILIVEGP